MTGQKINNLLIPNVSKIPGQKNVDVNKSLETRDLKNSEFRKLFEKEVDQAREASSKQGIELSIHAAKRIQERNLEMDGIEFHKIKGAIEKLREKGGQDSLVLTDKAAYIVDVNNSKIVTAMDRESIGENVFTKIDSTVIV